MENPAYLRPHRGGLILALGILGLVVCPLLGPIAWLLANQDLKEMDAGSVDPEGRGLVEAGRICGIVETALLAIPCVIGAVALVGFLLVGMLSAVA